MKCCGLDSVCVENVPGKGYYFCSECRKEVTKKSQVEYSEPMTNETIEKALEEAYKDAGMPYSSKLQYSNPISALELCKTMSVPSLPEGTTLNKSDYIGNVPTYSLIDLLKPEISKMSFDRALHEYYKTKLY